MTDDLKQLHAAPKTIYLQVDPEGIGPSEWDTLDGATWCAEQINDNDVCYVRSDRIEQLEAERDELKAALHKQVAHDKAVSYERCLDCDYPQKCTRETGCLCIKDHSPIANAALARGGMP